MTQDHLTPTAVPPLLSTQSGPRPAPARSLFAALLSLCLALFLLDALVSFADSSLILVWNAHALSALGGIISFLAALMSVAIYGLMGLTPMVPKRLFLPIPMFMLVTSIGVLPALTYFMDRFQQVCWIFSLCQVIVAIAILYAAQGRFSLRWPLVPVERLGTRIFSWSNLSAFALVTVFVLLPAIIFSFFICTALAVHHFSEGFMALHPNGFSVQARKYVRNDGRTIELFPMAHVADATFYHRISQTFPTNSVILMEGVTDDKNLLTNRISYRRMAKSLGLSEQRKEFVPTRGRILRADIDVDQFSPDTIGFLNLIMLIHTRGLTPATFQTLLEWSPPDRLQDEVINDLLRKRNQHLLKEIRSQLPQSENIVVPWGVAHMPGISRGIQKDGFRPVGTNEFMVIRFGRNRNQQGQLLSR